MKRKTILIIDDEKMVRDVGQKLLSRLGYQVITAKGGMAALEIYRRDSARVDLVILDMVMPDIDGGETFKRLKAINPSVPILISSGYPANGETRKMLQNGCDGFIQKPFGIQQLGDALEGLLSDH